MAHIAALTEDDVYKLKAVALYIVNKCGVIDIFHLLKILYFADRMHYAEWGTRLTKDTFCAMENGPVASNLYDVLKDVTGKKSLKKDSILKIISKAFSVSDPMYEHYVTATEKPDMDELSVSDVECLDKSIAENRDKPFSILSKKSHDIAWTDAHERNKNSEINPLLMAKAGGASNDMLNFIKENWEFDKMLMC